MNEKRIPDGPIFDIGSITLDPIDKARVLVQQHIVMNLEKTDPLPLSPFRVYVVWFCYILGGWKALVSSTLPDGRYYEITHNVQKDETYIDTYVKIHNRAIPEQKD